LGTKYSEALGLNFKDEDGKEKPVVMGSYGIGPGRLMGTIVEVHHDENGIIWPKEVAPFAVHMIILSESQSVKDTGEKIYKGLSQKGIEVLYDDRQDKSAGEKFADCDLIGLPKRIVVSEKTLAKESVELKERNQKETKLIKLDEIEKYLK
jgi:prolyl-tRNA synthetase